MLIENSVNFFCDLTVKKTERLISLTGQGLHRLGKTDVPIYDGSWTEWAMEPNMPKVGSSSA